MRGIRTEVVLYRLLIPNIYEDIAEDPYMRIGIKRRQKAALEHILDYRHRLQTYGFSSGIRTGNHKNARIAAQTNVKRDYLAPLAAKGKQKNRMDGMKPITPD